MIAGSCALASPLILALLVTLIAPSLLQELSSTHCSKVNADLFAIDRALEEFAIANGGRWPESLVALIAPDAKGNTYLDCSRLPRDPWGREYLYEPPGPGNPKPRVLTYGKDGKPGGKGDDADVDNLSISPR